jgi:Domain of unknown function (DUF6457)
MTTVDDWVAAACAELGIEPAQVDVRLVLDLARVAAHQVERSAAPLTAYLLGLAVGAGESGEDATARLTTLAEGWPAAQV